MPLVRWGTALQRRWQAIDPAERAGFIAGARFYARSLPPVFTWGLVTGVAMSKSILTIPQAIGMTILVYAGSSQLAVLPLLAAGLPIWTALLTAFIVNVRFVIFSAGLMQHFGHLPFMRRVLLGFFNGDLPYVFFSQRFPRTGPEAGKEGYFWGMTLTSWVAWQASSILGIVGASLFPDSWGAGAGRHAGADSGDGVDHPRSRHADGRGGGRAAGADRLQAAVPAEPGHCGGGRDGRRPGRG